MLENIKDWMRAHSDELKETWRKLNGLAEVGWQETKTTAFVAEKLKNANIPCRTFSDMTGVVCEWGDKRQGPTIALRADLDALLQSVDGVTRANHSCGHDAHAAMVLYAARCLRELIPSPPGRIKVIFQPAEETGRGARAMIARGIVDDVDYMLGIHVRPEFEVSAGRISPAIYHGAVMHVAGTVTGVQAHAARPELSINVIDSISAAVAAIHAVRLPADVPCSAKVTKIRAGESGNIIPDLGTFVADLRAQTNEAMDELKREVIRAAEEAVRRNGASVTFEVQSMLPAAVPNEKMEKAASRAIRALFGEKALCDPPVTPGGEDFHCYAVERPHLAATMIGLGCGLRPGLHHPHMTFEPDYLADGAAALAATVLDLFGLAGDGE